MRPTVENWPYALQVQSIYWNWYLAACDVADAAGMPLQSLIDRQFDYFWAKHQRLKEKLGFPLNAQEHYRWVEGDQLTYPPRERLGGPGILIVSDGTGQLKYTEELAKDG